MFTVSEETRTTEQGVRAVTPAELFRPSGSGDTYGRSHQRTVAAPPQTSDTDHRHPCRFGLCPHCNAYGLDTATGKNLVQLIFDIGEEQGCTLIIATHDPEIFHLTEITVHLRDGRDVKPEGRLSSKFK